MGKIENMQHCFCEILLLNCIEYVNIINMNSENIVDKRVEKCIEKNFLKFIY